MFSRSLETFKKNYFFLSSYSPSWVERAVFVIVIGFHSHSSLLKRVLLRPGPSAPEKMCKNNIYSTLLCIVASVLAITTCVLLVAFIRYPDEHLAFSANNPKTMYQVLMDIYTLLSSNLLLFHLI